VPFLLKDCVDKYAILNIVTQSAVKSHILLPYILQF